MLNRLRTLKGLAACFTLVRLIAGLCGLGPRHDCALRRHLRGLAHGAAARTMALDPREWLTGQAWGAALTQVLSQSCWSASSWLSVAALAAVANIPPLARNRCCRLPCPSCPSRSAGCSGTERGRRRSAISWMTRPKPPMPQCRCGQAASAIIPLLNLPMTCADSQVTTDAVCRRAGRARRGLRLNAVTPRSRIRTAATPRCAARWCFGRPSRKSLPRARVEWQHGQRLRALPGGNSTSCAFTCRAPLR
jgi:hypothetical protein